MRRPDRCRTGARIRVPRCRSLRSPVRHAQRGRAGGLEQPQQQRDRERGRGEGDDDSRDDQRLRHRIAAQPGAAPRRATTPKNRNTPLPRRLKARIFRSGCGVRDQAVEAETYRHRAAQPEHGRRAHRRGLPCGRAGQQQAERHRDRQRHRELDGQDQRLGKRHRIGKERGAQPRARRGRRRGKPPGRQSAPAAAVGG